MAYNDNILWLMTMIINYITYTPLNHTAKFNRSKINVLGLYINKIYIDMSKL